MHTFLTRPGRWMGIVAVALLTGEIAHGGDVADVKAVTVPEKSSINVDFTLGIMGRPEY